MNLSAEGSQTSDLETEIRPTDWEISLQAILLGYEVVAKREEGLVENPTLVHWQLSTDFPNYLSRCDVLCTKNDSEKNNGAMIMYA